MRKRGRERDSWLGDDDRGAPRLRISSQSEPMVPGNVAYDSSAYDQRSSARRADYYRPSLSPPPSRPPPMNDRAPLDHYRGWNYEDRPIYPEDEEMLPGRHFYPEAEPSLPPTQADYNDRRRVSGHPGTSFAHVATDRTVKGDYTRYNIEHPASVPPLSPQADGTLLARMSDTLQASRSSGGQHAVNQHPRNQAQAGSSRGKNPRGRGAAAPTTRRSLASRITQTPRMSLQDRMVG